MAVSGGVDSVVLLDVLRREPDLELVVAHFDHGMRADSTGDRAFVQALAERYGLPFVYEEGKLGAKASEATARAARYDFLQRVQQEHQAQAIITAHHQDDVLETAIINLLRGTGRKGLTALSSRDDVVRPLLDVPKIELVNYAKKRQLQWREDSSNANEAYLRNYVRHQILPRFDTQSRSALINLLTSLKTTNEELDGLLAAMLDEQLDRQWFGQLGHAEAREVLAAWLRQHGLRGFDRKMLERLVVAVKTGKPGQVYDVMQGATLQIDGKIARLEV